MEKHSPNITTSYEFRNGMRFPEIRIVCDCGWVEKAQSYRDVEKAIERHQALANKG